MIIKNLIAVEPSIKCLEQALTSVTSDSIFIVSTEKIYTWLQKEAMEHSLLNKHIDKFYSTQKFLNTFSESSTIRIATSQQMMLLTLSTLQQVNPPAMVYAEYYNQLIIDFYQTHAQQWPYHNTLLGSIKHSDLIKRHTELLLQADLTPPPIAQIKQLQELNNVELDTVFYIKTQDHSNLLALLKQNANFKYDCNTALEKGSIEAYEWDNSTSELLYIESLSKQPGTAIISADTKFKALQAAYKADSKNYCYIKAIGSLISTPKISLLELSEFLAQHQLDEHAISAAHSYLNFLEDSINHPPIIDKLFKLRLMFRNKANFIDIFKAHLNLARELNTIEVDGIIDDIGSMQPNINTNHYLSVLNSILNTYKADNSFSLHEACEIPGKTFIIQGANQKNWPAATSADLQLLRTRSNLIFTRTTCEQGLEQEPMHALSPLQVSFIPKKETLLAHPSPRPNPKPALSIRPHNISISGLELLIRDPYSYYARYILRLRAKERKSSYAKEFGIIIHQLLNMVQQVELPKSFVDFKELVMAKHGSIQHAEDAIIKRRINNLLPDLYSLLTELSEDLNNSFIEKEGSRKFGDETYHFKVSARSDRVDYLKPSGIRIIDYKSGTPPTQAEVDKGLYPQLPVEALIHEEDNISSIYIGVSGKLDKCTISSVALDLETTMNSLLELMAMFLQSKTIGYFAISDHDYKTKEYALLSRAEEWRYEI